MFSSAYRSQVCEQGRSNVSTVMKQSRGALFVQPGGTGCTSSAAARSCSFGACRLRERKSSKAGPHCPSNWNSAIHIFPSSDS